MSNETKPNRLEQVARLEQFADSFSRLGDDCVFTHVTPGTPAVSVLDAPMRIDGLTMLLCCSGSMHAQLNLSEYDITGGDLLVISPDTLTRITDVDHSATEVYIIFVSTRFLLDINIDVKTINMRAMIEHHTPVVSLSSDETAMLINYYNLLKHNADNAEPTVFTHSIARTLMSSVIYELMQINFSRLSTESTESDSLPRQNQYVHDFLTLVRIHYTRERSVTFYARKLCISAKYLTVLVKEATGRSASAWINMFVILEAKNLLRYSGKNVQQVAYALNFVTQSAFGKFFKHNTGQSPSDFQRS